MSVTLTVSISDEVESQSKIAIESCGEYTFRKPDVLIGRDTINDVHLIDPKRTVSRNHAKIVTTDLGYSILDLDSRNSTYLNGERLKAGEERSLNTDDVITIGFFNILVRIEPDSELTQVLSPPAANPFTDVASELVQAVTTVCSTFDSEEGEKKELLLYEALNQAFFELPPHDAVHVLAKSLSVQTRLADPVRDASTGDTPAPAAKDQVKGHVEGRELPTVFESSGVGRVYELLVGELASIVRDLIQIPTRFQAEFIGTTMMLDSESSFLYEGDIEVMKKYLLDSATSEEEVKAKVERLKQAAKKVVVHQVGMLEGYRAVIRHGVQAVLVDLDPEQFEGEIDDSNVLYRLFPFLRKAKLGQAYMDKFEELQGANWTVEEQRVYRPIFVRAYLLSTSSG